MPTVSVCLPVYNGAPYLSRAIESVLEQTLTDFELLIADDGSHDESLRIAERYARDDARIRLWLNESNRSLFGNYNYCFSQAAGLYIKPFAQDDILAATALEKMAAVLGTERGVSVVSCARQWIDDAGQIVEPESDEGRKIARPFSHDQRLSAKEAIGGTLSDILNWLGEPCSQMFRRAQMGSGFDASFKQIGDLEYTYRLLQSGDYFYLAEPLCSFRRHGESASKASTFDVDAALDWFLLAAKYRQFIPATGLSEPAFALALLQSQSRYWEYEMHYLKRLLPDERVRVLDAHLSDSPFAAFDADFGAARNRARELSGIGYLAFLQCVFLENDVRMAQKEIRQKDAQIDAVSKALHEAQMSLARAEGETREQLQAKDKEIAELKKALTDMGNSLSWKVTAPLRKLKGGQ